MRSLTGDGPVFLCTGVKIEPVFADDGFIVQLTLRDPEMNSFYRDLHATTLSEALCEIVKWLTPTGTTTAFTPDSVNWDLVGGCAPPTATGNE